MLPVTPRLLLAPPSPNVMGLNHWGTRLLSHLTFSSVSKRPGRGSLFLIKLEGPFGTHSEAQLGLLPGRLWAAPHLGLMFPASLRCFLPPSLPPFSLKKQTLRISVKKETLEWQGCGRTKTRHNSKNQGIFSEGNQTYYSSRENLGSSLRALWCRLRPKKLSSAIVWRL